MFSFFKKKTPPSPAPEPSAPPATDAPAATDAATGSTPAAPKNESSGGVRQWLRSTLGLGSGDGPAPSADAAPEVPIAPAAPPILTTAPEAQPQPAVQSKATQADIAAQPKPPEMPAPVVAVPADTTDGPSGDASPTSPEPQPKPGGGTRASWMARLTQGLRKTSSSIGTLFTGTRIDETLYEELEDALLMADTGVTATAHLLADLRQRVKSARATEAQAVRDLLIDALADLLAPLEKPLSIGEHTPTVLMVAGVNGAGKTTTIGKLTRHLADHDQRVLLAAADTFRAAAREQLGVWATRNTVQIISQDGGDPAAVSFDAVSAGKARGCDVVLVDTAGRLPTQLHLMEELKKIRRVIGKAQDGAPHEVLLVIDGNTGQNALHQVRAFDAALQLTGLIVTKLDGTAKGGVLAAIAREHPVPVYFIGVGEGIEDLQTFNAREFAQALLG